MPNANISSYLNDEDYGYYVRNKEKCNKLARDIVKQELSTIKASKLKTKKEKN